MVSIAHIRAHIAQLTENKTPRIAVFFGGTSGIGKQALSHLVRLKHPIRAYVIGRKATETSMRSFLEHLRNINPKSELIWMEAEASLLSEVTRVCGIIKDREESVDLLFMSAGYAPFAGRNNTTEGIDITHSLGYYARMLFTHHLIPLLRASPFPIVISVLSGPHISPTFPIDDLHLEKEGAWSGLGSQLHVGTMNTLTLDHYASQAENSRIRFIHDWPGYVNTGNSQRYANRNSVLGNLKMGLMQPVFWVSGHGMGLEESGERHVFMATGGRFGGKGANKRGNGLGGLWSLDERCDVGYDEGVLGELRGKARDVVWRETMEILKPYS